MADSIRRIMLITLIVSLCGCKTATVETAPAELAPAKVASPVVVVTPVLAQAATEIITVEPSAKLVENRWGNTPYIELTESNGKIRKVQLRGSSNIKLMTKTGEYLISPKGNLLEYKPSKR